jgi:O-antigen/teichoic acid export membrane protein
MAQFGHLVSGAAWAVAGKVIQFLLSLVTLAVVARLVGPEAYGVYALGWLLLGIFDIVIGGAPTDTLVQRKVASPGHFNATFWATLAVAGASWLLVWLVAEPVSGWLNGGAALAAILPIRAVAFVLRALSVCPSAQLLRDSRFRGIAKTELAATVLSNLVGLGLAFAGAGIWSLVGMELTRALAVTIGTFWLTGWRPGIAARLSDFRDLLAFNAATWGSWGLHYVRGQLPRLMLGASLGPQAVGFYALAQRLADQLNDTLLVPVYNVVQSGVARNQDDRAGAARLTAGTLRANAIVTTPLFLGLAGIAPLLVPAVFGNDWQGAVPVVQILMLAAVLTGIATIHAAVVRGMGKPQWEMMGALVATVVAAASVAVLVRWGLVAATVGLLFSCIVLLPIETAYVRRLTGLSAWSQLAPACWTGIAAAAMTVVILALGPAVSQRVPVPLAIGMLIPVGALVYYLALCIVMPSAARLIESIVKAALRRDFAAVRRAAGLQPEEPPPAPATPEWRSVLGLDGSAAAAQGANDQRHDHEQGREGQNAERDGSGEKDAGVALTNR